MKEFTKKEQAVIDALKNADLEDQYAGYPIPDLIGIAGLDTMQAVGGVIGSLVEKGICYIQTAEEYSLGCDCIDLL